METPASGMMGLSPGILGLNLMASAGVVVSGHEKSVVLTVQGTATTKEDIDLEEYLPNDDFDGDPFSNSEEIADGSDPTNALDIPATEAEGDESVVSNLESSPHYNLGVPDTAAVTILDLPADDWRFNNLPNPNSPEAADAADPDKDGISNLLEYVLRLGPGVPDTIELPELLLDEDEQGDFDLALGYTRYIDAIDLINTIEVSEDLQTWTSNMPGQEDVTPEISRIDNLDGTETITERDHGNLSDSPSRYIRLRVERAASP